MCESVQKKFGFLSVQESENLWRDVVTLEKVGIRKQHLGYLTYFGGDLISPILKTQECIVARVADRKYSNKGTVVFQFPCPDVEITCSSCIISSESLDDEKSKIRLVNLAKQLNELISNDQFSWTVDVDDKGRVHVCETDNNCAIYINISQQHVHKWLFYRISRM